MSQQRQQQQLHQSQRDSYNQITKIKITETETITQKPQTDFKIIQIESKKKIPIPISSKKRKLHKNIHIEEFDYEQDYASNYEETKTSIRIPYNTENKSSQPRRSSKTKIINIKYPNKPQPTNKLSSYIIRNNSSGHTCKNFNTNINFNNSNSNSIATSSIRGSRRGSRSPNYNRSIINLSKNPSQRNVFRANNTNNCNSNKEIPITFNPLYQNELTTNGWEESNFEPYEHESYKVYGGNSNFCTPLRYTINNNININNNEKEYNPNIHYYDHAYLENEIQPQKSEKEIFEDKVIKIQSVYRSYYIRKNITYNLNMFLVVKNLIDVLYVIYHKRRERFVWFKLRQFYFYRKEHYLKNYYGIKVSKIPVMYKKFFKVDGYSLLKKEYCDSFQYIHINDNNNNNEQLDQINIKDKMLKQLLVVKMLKEEMNLRLNLKKFQLHGIIYQRDNNMKCSLLRSIVQKKDNNVNENLRKMFRKFYYISVMKQMKNNLNKTKFDIIYRRLIKIVNKKEKDMNDIMQKWFYVMYRGGISGYECGNENISKAKGKLRSVVKTKIDKDNKLKYKMFMKLYFMSLYNVVNNKNNGKIQTKEFVINILQKEENDNGNNRYNEDKWMSPFDNVLSSINEKKQYKNEFNDINNNNKSHKQKVRHLRKLITIKNKNINDKLKFYFHKFYSNGIISNLLKSSKHVYSTYPRSSNIIIQNQKRNEQITLKLIKLYFNIEKNNLLFAKNIFSQWNLISKLLLLKNETTPKKKKRKSLKKSLKDKSIETEYTNYTTITTTDINNNPSFSSPKKLTKTSKKKKQSTSNDIPFDPNMNIVIPISSPITTQNSQNEEIIIIPDNTTTNIHHNFPHFHPDSQSEEVEYDDDQQAHLKNIIHMMISSKSNVN